MHYTFHQLQILVAVAEELSITKTAERLHLTQPAISIQLKKLQEQFDVPLTEIIGRKLYVTEFGQTVVTSARRILDEAADLENQTLAFKGYLTGNLSISIVSTAKYIMPYFLKGFLHQHQQVKLNMDVTNKSRVIEHLEKNDVDFAMVSVLPENMRLNTEVFMQNKLYLVGATHVADLNLEDVPLIFREQGSATRVAMERFLKAKNIRVKRSITLTSNEAVKQAILAGLGYSIMPLIGIKNEVSMNELHLIGFEGLPLVTEWNLVWLKEKRLSPIAKAYLQFVKTAKERIISELFGT